MDNRVGIFTLKGARANADITQKEAALKIGVSNKTLCNWEKGISMPNAQQIDSLCRLYGRKYDEIDFLPNNPLKAE